MSEKTDRKDDLGVARADRPLRGRWPVWTLGSIGLLLVAGGLLGVWLHSLWQRGQALEERVLLLGAVVDERTLVRDPTDLATLGLELTAARDEAEALAADARPAMVLATGLGWVPWVGGDLRSLSTLLERATRDLGAASLAARALAELQGAYRDLSAIPLDAPAMSTIGEDLVARASQAAERLQEAQRILATSQARASPAEARFTASLWERLRAQEEELETVLRLGQGAADLLGATVEVRLAAQRLLSSDGQTSSSSAELRDRLAALGAQAEKARDTLGQAGGSFSGLEGLAESLDALVRISEGAALATESLTRILEALQAEEGGLLHNGPGVAAAIAAAEEESVRLDQAIVLLEQGTATLARLSESGVEVPSFFAGSLPEMSRLAERTEAAARLLRDLTPLAPSLFGLEGPRTYLILGHSADELRATGGFVSTLWFVTFADGEMADVRFQDVVLVDDWDRLADYPTAPRPLEEHMGAWVWLMRDVSWEPDFPSAAQTALDMLEIGQRWRADGVIAINQWTFLGLLEALEEIPAPEGEEAVTPANFLPFMERKRDEHPHSYFDILMQGILSRLNEPMDQGEMVRVAAAMERLLRERQLFLYSEDPRTEEALRRLEWAGDLRREAGDYLLIIDANVGWTKGDRNIERKASYTVSLAESGQSHAALTLTYRNLSGPGASGCEHQWTPIHTYEALKNACYWNYLRAYVPRGARLQHATPLPLPEGSSSAEAGVRPAGASTLDVGTAYDRTVFGGLLVVPPGEERSVTFLYDTPALLEREGDLLRYRLLLQPQAGTLGRAATIELRFPTGYGLSASSQVPQVQEAGRAVFSLDLREDTVLEVLLMPLTGANS